MFQPSVPLAPKQSSGPLKVLVIGRISTPGQNMENINASYRFVEEHLKRIYGGPMEFRHLGEQASGMLADRVTIRTAEDLIATGEWDLVIAEDLSRIFRNPRHQFCFVQDAVDAGSRVICIGDNLDSADENWEIMMGAAALRHGTAIPDIRRRVRRTATHAFHNGGMVFKVKFGYRKLSAEEARTSSFGPAGLRIARQPECTPILQEMKDRILAGESYAAVADRLERHGIAHPPYAARWTARLVRSLLMDPILSGLRIFRRVIHRPIYRSGKHRREINASPEQRHYPELAHFTRDEHGKLLDEIARRTAQSTSSVRAREKAPPQPRSRVLWPGQHAHCAICGDLMYSFGRYLKCRRSKLRGNERCWNRVQVEIATLRRKAVAWLVETSRQAPPLRDTLVEFFVSQQSEISSERDRSATEQIIRDLERQANHLTDAIARGGQLDPLLERLRVVTNSLDEARRTLNRPSEPGARPRTRQEIETELECLCRTGVDTSLEFANLMRRLLSDFVIQPVQALDTAQIRPRAQWRLTLSQGRGVTPEDCPFEPVQLFVFEPPAHIRLMETCRQRRSGCARESLQQLAAALDVSVMTVKRYLDYVDRMQSLGIDTPYRELTVCPVSASRWTTGS